MPLEDADFRSLRTLLVPLLRDKTQREYWVSLVFPTNPVLRNKFPVDTLLPEEYTLKLVLYLYEQNPVLLIEFLQVIRDEQAGNLAQTLQPYLNKLHDDERFARGPEHANKLDFTVVVTDHTETIRLNPQLITDDDLDFQYADAYRNRAAERFHKNDFDGTIADLTEAIRLQPDANAYNNRGLARQLKGDEQNAAEDFAEAKRLGYKE